MTGRRSKSAPADRRNDAGAIVARIDRLRATHLGRRAGGGFARPTQVGQARDFDGSFLYCRGFFAAGREAERQRLEHRLPRRRQQFLVRLWS